MEAPIHTHTKPFWLSITRFSFLLYGNTRQIIRNCPFKPMMDDDLRSWQPGLTINIFETVYIYTPQIRSNGWLLTWKKQLFFLLHLYADSTKNGDSPFKTITKVLASEVEETNNSLSYKGNTAQSEQRHLPKGRAGCSSLGSIFPLLFLTICFYDINKHPIFLDSIMSYTIR